MPKNTTRGKQHEAWVDQEQLARRIDRDENVRHDTRDVQDRQGAIASSRQVAGSVDDRDRGRSQARGLALQGVPDICRRVSPTMPATTRRTAPSAENILAISNGYRISRGNLL